MTSENILDLYKQGHSIDYIIQQCYRSKTRENKIINFQTRRIICIQNDIKKSDVRGYVYKIIYSEIKK